MSGREESIPLAVKWINGSLAGMGASTIVQPLDLVKNRMQVSVEGKYSSSASVLFQVASKEGIFKLYDGLTAAYLRQLTYGGARLSMYHTLYEKFSSDNGKTPPSFGVKLSIGLASGAVGAFVGTPSEVALIRMTSDGNAPPSQRRNYRNVFDALVRIFREEGVTALWRGAVPTIQRAMVVTGTQLSSYSQAKEAILSNDFVEIKDGAVCHFFSSMVAGFVCTVASVPIDMTKTRIQNMKYTNGIPEYSGTLDVIRKVVRNEGIFALWKGFTPYYLRLGPHTMIFLMFMEQLNKGYKSLVRNSA